MYYSSFEYFPETPFLACEEAFSEFHSGFRLFYSFKKTEIEVAALNKINHKQTFCHSFTKTYKVFVFFFLITKLCFNNLSRSIFNIPLNQLTPLLGDWLDFLYNK
ncbi:unnamed protein product [Rhizophagus irregularis]|nr:unnamed protein product [Rhizophagus irregularis]